MCLRGCLLFYLELLINISMIFKLAVLLTRRIIELPGDFFRCNIDNC